jgi:hypothetical protein
MNKNVKMKEPGNQFYTESVRLRGSGTVIGYGSGSSMVRKQITVPVPLRQKVTVPSVPVPQH